MRRRWIGRPSLAISYPDGTDATKVIVMDGQDGYAGLTVVAEVRLDHGRWDWHGYILDGDLPPAPTIELAEGVTVALGPRIIATMS